MIIPQGSYSAKLSLLSRDLCDKPGVVSFGRFLVLMYQLMAEIECNTAVLTCSPDAYLQVFGIKIQEPEVPAEAIEGRLSSRGGS